MNFEYNLQIFLTIPESKACKVISCVIPGVKSSLILNIKCNPENKPLNKIFGDGV